MPVAERFHGANTIEAGRLSPYWGEHAARYRFALDYVADKRVLDIACGTGYGIGIMQDKASAVVGVDLDNEALQSARAECAGSSLAIRADGLSLPFADGIFDVVTSFETLEHLTERPAFLAELYRVLLRGGRLILSTPNAIFTQPVNGIPSNPYHVHEYEPAELRSELARYFEIESYLGQVLHPSIRVPPFTIAQQRLPNDLRKHTAVLAWRAFNKIPVRMRERLSDVIWQKPFYPGESDYLFTEESLQTAPVTVAVCRKIQ